MHNPCSPRTFHPLLLVAMTFSVTVLMGCPEPTEPSDDDATITDDDDSTPVDDDDATTPAPNLDADGDGSNDQDDCADNDPNMFPGNTEICDGKDNNCDDVLPPAEQDSDFDGLASCEGDCDDGNQDVGPFFDEVCGDGIDNDCSEGDEVCPDTDLDNDGYNADVDCDDGNPAANPGGSEICGNGIDEDCSGLDSDGDSDCDMVPDGADEIFAQTGNGAICLTDDVIPFSGTVYAVGYNVPAGSTNGWCNTSTATDHIGMPGFGDVYCVYASWWPVGTLLRFTWSNGTCDDPVNDWANYHAYCEAYWDLDSACWDNEPFNGNSYSVCASVYAGPSGNAFDLGANCQYTY